jgi:hypothetical protein
MSPRMLPSGIMRFLKLSIIGPHSKETRRAMRHENHVSYQDVGSGRALESVRIQES